MPNAKRNRVLPKKLGFFARFLNMSLYFNSVSQYTRCEIKSEVYFWKSVMTIQEFQNLIDRIYYSRDSERGVEGTFVWFTEEVGELAKEIRREQRDIERLRAEFADVFAWMSTLASLLGVDLTEAAKIYAAGCPKCESTPCDC